MSKNTNDQPLNNLEEIEIPYQEKKSLLQRYFKNPFSVAWSKLTALIKCTQNSSESEVLENYQFDEEYNSNSIHKQHFYCRFTDRVDPSLYYTILFHHDRF